MAQLLNMANARTRQAARQALKVAEIALADAERRMDADCGVGINLALISRIRAAEKRVAKAREALRQIDPNATE